MTNKAYIVANEQQEREVLKQLEKERCSWNDIENTPPTEWHLGRYPYAIFVKYGKKLVWGFNVDVSEVEIVAEDKQDKFKISKEEQMSDKYVVSQEFMDELEEWKDNLKMNGKHSVYDYDIHEFSDIIEDWWSPVGIRDYEQNNRLIAILRWVNGEGVFEIEKPTKWVVRSKEKDSVGDYWYIQLTQDKKFSDGVCDLFGATKFDTKEEAESWANSHQEVIEVEG